MARTIRNLPEWAKNVDWSCGFWQVNSMRFSGVSCCKSNRGDGKLVGWSENDSPKQKVFGKKMARRCSRRHAANLIREELNNFPEYIPWYSLEDKDPEYLLQCANDALDARLDAELDDEYLSALDDLYYMDF